MQDDGVRETFNDEEDLRYATGSGERRGGEGRGGEGRGGG